MTDIDLFVDFCDRFGFGGQYVMIPLEDGREKIWFQGKYYYFFSDGSFEIVVDG